MTTQEQYRFGYFAVSTSVFMMPMAVHKTNLWSNTSTEGFTCYLKWTILIIVYSLSLCSFYLVQGSDPGYIHQDCQKCKILWIHMHTYLSVCICVYIFMPNISTSIYIYMYIYMYIYTCIYVCINVLKYDLINIHLYGRMCI
mgnify:CR=1 FL=1